MRPIPTVNLYDTRDGCLTFSIDGGGPTIDPCVHVTVRVQGATADERAYRRAQLLAWLTRRAVVIVDGPIDPPLTPSR